MRQAGRAGSDLSAGDTTVRLWGRTAAHWPPSRGIPTWHRGRLVPDGEALASGSYDRTVRLWNTGGQQLAMLPGHRDRVRTVAWSPSGTTLASGAWDTTVRLWR